MPRKRVSFKAVPRRKEPLKKVKEPALKISAQTDLVSLEEDARRRADKVLNAIEKFLAKWDSQKAKAAGVTDQVTRLKRFYDSLSEWQNASLKAKNSKDQTGQIKRLRNFVSIYRGFSLR